MAIEEFIPGYAARIYIKVDRVKCDQTKKCPALAVTCRDKDTFRKLKQLMNIAVMGHLESMRDSSSLIAVADEVIDLG